MVLRAPNGERDTTAGDAEPAAIDADADIVSPIPDLTQQALHEVLAADDSAFAHALRRVREEAEHPQDVVAGFQNVMV